MKQLDFQNSSIQRILNQQAKIESISRNLNVGHWSYATEVINNLSSVSAGLSFDYNKFSAKVLPGLQIAEEQRKIFKSVVQPLSVSFASYATGLSRVYESLRPAYESFSNINHLLQSVAIKGQFFSDTSYISEAYNGLGYATKALESVSKQFTYSPFKSLIEKAYVFQQPGYVYEIEDITSLLDDIDELTVNAKSQENVKIWKDKQFTLSFIISVIALLWAVYSYFFPYTSAKQEAYDIAISHAEERKAEALEYIAEVLDKQSEEDALERIAEEAKKQAEEDALLELKNQNEENKIIMEKLMESLLDLNELYQEIEEYHVESNLSE